MELFHVLNRGVEKRQIFLDDRDRTRFVTGLDLFNDCRSIDNLQRLIDSSSVRPRRSNRKPLVAIHGWCLMGNHYHILLSEIEEHGITKFLMKLNVGYAKYFNQRYKRSGTLFQGRSKKILIQTEAHFLYILHYVHLNPLDLRRDTASWREGKVINIKTALEYLDSYKWSSYLDHSGKPNFSELLTTSLFQEKPRVYVNTLKSYLQTLSLEEIEPLLLE